MSTLTIVLSVIIFLLFLFCIRLISINQELQKWLLRTTQFIESDEKIEIKYAQFRLSEHKKETKNEN